MRKNWSHFETHSTDFYRLTRCPIINIKGTLISELSVITVIRLCDGFRYHVESSRKRTINLVPDRNYLSYVQQFTRTDFPFVSNWWIGESLHYLLITSRLPGHYFLVVPDLYINNMYTIPFGIAYIKVWTYSNIF